jgi:hypothetical protein
LQKYKAFVEQHKVGLETTDFGRAAKLSKARDDLNEWLKSEEGKETGGIAKKWTLRVKDGSNNIEDKSCHFCGTPVKANEYHTVFG